MPLSLAEKRTEFRRLHESGCFLLPNPWDVGGARLLQGLGFKAMASTSAGAAWTMGKPDGRVNLEAMLAHLAMLAEACDLPLNADFQNGFEDAPHDVGINVSQCVATGVAGLSIEDSTGSKDAPLYDFDLAVERIKAARAAIDASGMDVVLTARSEGFLVGRADLDETIRRLTAFSAAGADCLYAPGLPDLDAVSAVVKAVAPKPVNVLLGWAGQTVSDLAARGVRRVSAGGALARAAWGGFIQAANDMAGAGAYQPFLPLTPFKNLNEALSG